MQTVGRWLAAGWLALAMVACSPPEVPEEAGEVPQSDLVAETADAGSGAVPVVVATIFPVASLLEDLVGDAAEVVTLVPGGTSPHTFELTPQLATKVAAAALVVAVGEDLDAWLDDVVSGGSGKVVRITEMTTLLPITDQEAHVGHSHSLNDPHVWLDPIRVRDDILPALSQALGEVLPDHAARIDERLQMAQHELTALDEEIRQTIDEIENRKYVAAHSAWRYFNERYGLELVATVEEIPGTEPSAQWLASVIEAAKSSGAVAIFSESQVSDNFAQTVSRETGLKVGELDPLGGPEIEGRHNYGEVIRYNADMFWATMRAEGDGS